MVRHFYFIHPPAISTRYTVAPDHRVVHVVSGTSIIYYQGNFGVPTSLLAQLYSEVTVVSGMMQDSPDPSPHCRDGLRVFTSRWPFPIAIMDTNVPVFL